VKVQYPGIGTSIKSDMTIMRGVARGLANTHLILQSLDEIEARLMEEVDYRIEAENTRWFKQNINLEGIYVPTVYDELSTEHIITSEFVEGLHLNEWLATNPPQEQRNQTAQLLYDFFTYSFKTLKQIHSDPNPGNFLFHEDGTITLIDFGCIRKFSDRFSNEFPKCMRGYIEDDAESVFDAYRGMGMAHAESTDKFYQDVLRPFGQWVALPYLSESFDFGQHAGYTQQGKPAIMNMQKHIDVERFAEEMVFQNRTWHGLYQIFEKMGAVVTLKGSF
jgi:predicted unusual protein kinase regulating ubiquinone biosynthesis (AarF/ABC1/UbiB family)